MYLTCNASSFCSVASISNGHSHFLPLYGAANNMDPGPRPALPELTEFEEMLIARMNVAVQVCLSWL